jgi:hypothetical protein
VGPGEIKSWVIQDARKNAGSRTTTTKKDEDDLVAATPLCERPGFRPNRATAR